MPLETVTGVENILNFGMTYWTSFHTKRPSLAHRKHFYVPLEASRSIAASLFPNNGKAHYLTFLLSRLKEIKREMTKSEKLKAYFEENPADQSLIKHDEVNKYILILSTMMSVCLSIRLSVYLLRISISCTYTRPWVLYVFHIKKG